MHSESMGTVVSRWHFGGRDANSFPEVVIQQIETSGRNGSEPALVTAVTLPLHGQKLLLRLNALKQSNQNEE